MSGCTQQARWLREWRRAGEPQEWRSRFIPAGPRSRKVRCIDCGRSGYPGGLYPHGWQLSCLIGHAYRCGDCGAPVQNLDRHWSCTLRHWLCTTHLDTQHRALQRLLEAS